jgi:hypothetical protein
MSTNELYSFQDIAHILFCRETLFSSVNKRPYLRTAMNLTSRNSQLYEVKALRESFKISRDFEGSQESLKAAMSLSKQVEPSASLGLNIEGAAKFDVANVLWDQGEMATSIRMLQQLNEQGDLHKQTLSVSRAEVLASLVSIVLFIATSLFLAIAIYFLRPKWINWYFRAITLQKLGWKIRMQLSRNTWSPLSRNCEATQKAKKLGAYFTGLLCSVISSS